jgi:hypothetical protein
VNASLIHDALEKLSPVFGISRGTRGYGNRSFAPSFRSFTELLIAPTARLIAASDSLRSRNASTQTHHLPLARTFKRTLAFGFDYDEVN